VIGPTRAFARASLALLLTCGVALCGLFAASAFAAEEATIDYVHESEAAFAKQLAKKEVASVTINKRLRTMRVTLKDGSHYLAQYPKKAEPQTVSRLEGKGVSVSVLSKSEAEKETTHKGKKHKLRYIVGGVLIVVILLVGGFLLYRRRGLRD